MEIPGVMQALTHVLHPAAATHHVNLVMSRSIQAGAAEYIV
jgi:hypothetical protein